MWLQGCHTLKLPALGRKWFRAGVAYVPLTSIPTSIAKGEAVQWLTTLNDYLPSAYTLKWNAGGYGLAGWTLTATTSGTQFLTSVTNALSSALTVGHYDLVGTVYETSVSPVVQTFEVFRGRIQVTPNIITQSGYDSRTTARKVLDALDAALITFSAGTVKSATIEGVTYTRDDVPNLMVLRDRMRVEVRNEENAIRAAQGLGLGNKILGRFVTR